MYKAWLYAVLCLTCLSGAPAAASTPAAPVLLRSSDFQQMAEAADRYPLFRDEVARAHREVDAQLDAPLQIPVPKDPGGGYTHEQHKRNYKAIYAAGMLYRLSGDARYADYVRRMLLGYAELYPTLGRHPSARGKSSGRLFWQPLNDAVWLVYAIQGYDAVREAIDDADRRRIDDDVFRRMASFLSDESPKDFDRIHNHATWSVAGVGMTGYVLRDPALVHKALYGTDGSGKGGFLRQMDLLFSPDGYYTEGPYYERYALQPFVTFARAIDVNEPQRRIFAVRHGILLKAIRTTVQLTYGGFFFPLNDALKDKSLATEELYQGIAVAYAQTGDASLLDIAARQQRTVLSPDGLAVARGLAEGLAQPFHFTSLRLGDGADGTHGDLVVLRSGDARDGQALIMKNTAQGMGHGHFDKLSWMFYDNGEEVITDYGAARFLNIEAKSGGVYLPENTSWAKQTVAHNTLVVDETSHFDGDWKRGQQLWPTPLFYEAGEQTQIAAATIDSAYPGVSFTRTLALLRHPALPYPVVVDLLRAHSRSPVQFDLPLHYHGHIIDVGFTAEVQTKERPVLGTRNGYQHLWVDARGRADGDSASLRWLLKDRFYTYRFLPPAGAELILAESGASDPHFNLRREPMLMQRVRDTSDATFVGVLEPHGRYDGAAEVTRGEGAPIAALARYAGDDADAIVLTIGARQRIVLAIARDAAPQRRHHVTVQGRDYEWNGYYARFDE